MSLLRHAFVLLVLLSLASPALARKAPPPADVLLIGSSSMGGALGYELIRRVEALGLTTLRVYRSSAGLCRPDFFDWWKEIAGLPVGERTRAAFVYLGGNDAQGMRLRKDEQVTDARGRSQSWIRYGQPGWDERYVERVRSLTDQLCEQGVPRVLWLALLDARRGELQARYEHLRALQRRGVEASRCGHYVDTTGDAAVLGTREERKRSLRSRDGVHPTRLGAEVVWERIATEVLALLLDGPPLPAAGPERALPAIDSPINNG